jgi:hypothetical protein
MSRRVSIFGSSFTSVVTYLLDDATIADNLTAGFATFRMRTGYVGPIINVRRTVGAVTTVVSIGLGSANSITLDSPILSVVTGSSSATTLGQFVAATGYANPDGIAANQDGRASAGFEQIGGAQIWTQTTATRQPWIVTAGVLETKNGIAALRFAGAQKCEYGVLGGATKPTDYSIIDVMTVDAYNAINFTGMLGSIDSIGSVSSSWGTASEFRGLGATFINKLFTTYGNGTTDARFRSTNDYWVLSQQQLHEQYKTNGVFGISAFLNNASVPLTTVSGTLTSTGGVNRVFSVGENGERTTTGMIGNYQLLLVYTSVKSSVRSAIVTKLNQILGTTW